MQITTDPGVATELQRRSVRFGGKSGRGMRQLHPALTPRELEILRLVVAGFTNPRIAGQLFLSTETVKTHVRHILEKLDAVDRTQAAVEAIKRGLV